MSTPADRKTNWSVMAAVGAALAASACCAIPLLLVGLGLGGAWIGTLTALEPLRPLFIGLAVGALGFAGYREWRTSRTPDCDCETSMPAAMRRTLLVIGLVAVAGFIASPWIVRDTASAGAGLPVKAADQSSTTEAPLEQIVLEVEGMTCASCNVTVRKALTNVDGVRDAAVTFDPPRAVVRYDPAKVSVDALTQATADVGYPSRVKGAL